MIDTATFRQLEETAGADFVRELVDTFAEEAPATLAELRDAWEAKSAERFRRAAHTLKSNGHTFGAEDFAALARQLETGGLPADATPIEALHRSCESALVALRELCRG